jgi:quinol monooxygenase YgiN
MDGVWSNPAEEDPMSASNVVRFRVKPGQEREFIQTYEAILREEMPGSQDAFLIRTGEREFCFVGQWESMEALAAARPTMIGMLDRFRHMLEDLGGGMGVTDPVSGEVVARSGARQAQPA